MCKESVDLMDHLELKSTPPLLSVLGIHGTILVVGNCRGGLCEKSTAAAAQQLPRVR